MDLSSIPKLSPFNLFEWKDNMEIIMRNRGLYRVLKGIEVKPNAVLDKANYLNKLDEAFGLLCLSISRHLLFHLFGLKTPKEVWTMFESLFGQQDDLREHQLENALISLSLSSFESIKNFFTKFKKLFVQLKLCGIEKKDEQLILSILSKLGLDYSVFVSTFQTTKLSIPNWKMPTLDAFILSLTKEHEKLVQMEVIKPSRDQALAVGEGKNANGKGKKKGKEKKQYDEQKRKESFQKSEGTSNSKRGKQNQKEKTKCPYCNKSFHHESACMKKTIDLMAQLLEKNNLPVPAGVRRKEADSKSKDKERCHALMADTLNSSSFIIDSGASRHMFASRDLFSESEPTVGPSILMGDDLEVPSKGIGRMNLDNGCFNDALYVPTLEANTLSVY